MSTKKEYEETFPGIFALGSMVKANRVPHGSSVAIKKKKTTPKKKGAKTRKSKQYSAIKTAEKLIY
jgi:hypothetical protein